MDYTYVNENTQNSGYTNTFLTERHNDQIFNTKYKDFDLYEKTTSDNNHFIKTIERNPLECKFFSKENLDLLQELIIKNVFTKSDGNWRISRQSDNELLIIMRSIYLQYGKNLPYEIDRQVEELDKQVLIYVIPSVMSSIQQHLAYVRDAGSTVRPLDRGEISTMKGTRANKGFSSLFI
jgi:hypothetical protein